MKRRLCWLLSLALALTLTACCGGGNPVGEAAETLGLDLTGGEIAAHTDSHGSFHGDGTAWLVLTFPDGGVAEQLTDAEGWEPLPMEGLAQAVAWGTDDGAQAEGPYLTDEESGEALIPLVEEGYYFFRDESPAGMVASNVTVAVYDSGADILYYGRMDS